MIAPPLRFSVSLAALLWSASALLAQARAPAPAETQAPAELPRLVPPEAFDVPEGLAVTVWATSPLLFNPTNIDVDQRGRIWVTEGVNYRGKAKRRPEGDRVVVLTDTDGDGAADDSRVFVQEPTLVSPLGIAVFDNVVVVSQPPDLLVYTDVDRDLRFDPDVDKREVLLTGFQGKNHDHSLHSVTAGPDGKWYWNSGNCGAVFTDRSGKTFRITSSYMDPRGVAGQVSDDGHVWVGGFTARMNPDGTDVEIVGHNYRNSYEQVVTSYGDVFQSDNDDPPACRVSHVLERGNAGFSSRDGQRSWQAERRPGQSTEVAEWRQEDPGVMPAGDVYGGGSPTGVAFYENGALDKKWRGLLLACEPGRNTIFGYFPKPEGAGFALERFEFLTTNPEQKFVGSDFTGGRWDGQLHTQFRPSDVCVGADGAIYVADWFDGRVGGHQTLDDTLGGAIYRIAPKGFRPDIPEYDLDTLEGQVAALKSPAINVRQLGRTRLLAEKPDLTALWKAFGRFSNDYVARRLSWITPRLSEANRERATSGADRPDPFVRKMVLRTLRAAGSDMRELSGQLARDEDAAVRATVATSLFDADPNWAVPALVEIGRRFDGKDRSYLEAFGIGCTGKEAEVYAALFAGLQNPLEWTDAQALLAWRLGAPAAVADFVARTRANSLSEDERQRMLTGLAFVRDRQAANAMLDLAADPNFALRGDALWWCLNRMGNEWREFGVREQLKARGLYDPEAVTITPITLPQAPDAPLAFTVDDVLQLEGDAANGRLRAATCYTCHKLGDVGVEFGPDLTAFGRTQSRRAIVEAILHPSKSISHGFEGHRVETDAGDVDGVVLSRGDPVIVKSQGGLLQLIPKARVKKIRRLRRSLMWPPQLFALDAQSTADLVAFLQEQSR